MSEVRLRVCKSRSKRAREVQGILAMHGLESEMDLRSTNETERLSTAWLETSGMDPHTALATEIKPLPYRMVLANWPDNWRERWGLRANQLEDEGLGWRDAEVRAFVEIWNQLRVSNNVQRN